MTHFHLQLQSPLELFGLPPTVVVVLNHTSWEKDVGDGIAVVVLTRPLELPLKDDAVSLSPARAPAVYDTPLPAVTSRSPTKSGLVMDVPPKRQ